jgi:beta-phosphoglucomutase
MRAPGSITTIIFDFDGVLADTEGLHLRAFQQVFGGRGWRLDDDIYFGSYLGFDDEGLVGAFGRDQRLGLSASEVSALVEEKGRVFAGYVAAGDVLFPAARACVERLGSRFTLGIASGALKHEITGILGGAGLVGHFATIVSSEDVTECKPAPEPYLTAASRLGVAPTRCLAIEDSPPGLEAARAAGLVTIGITTTAARGSLTADLVVDSLDEISLDLVARLGA